MTNAPKTRAVKASPSIHDEVATKATPTQEELAAANAQTDEAPSSKTRANMSRAGATSSRADRLKREELKNKYRSLIDQPKLAIGDAIRNRFLEAGYELRWVKFREGKNGVDDIANVKRKEYLGYIFVTPQEIPEYSVGTRPVPHQVFGDLITVDELALAKIRVEDAEAYRDVLAEKVQNASQGIVTELNDPKNKKFFRADPFNDQED